LVRRKGRKSISGIGPGEREGGKMPAGEEEK
jgi:hypothetical protein